MEADAMRGHIEPQNPLFVVLNLEEMVPAEHPLRKIKGVCRGIFASLRADFDRAYAATGRRGIPPEQLLLAMLLQALYSIRSERQLMQDIGFNLLYRWFLELPLDQPVWTPEVFSMNRQRFEDHQLVRKFFDAVVALALDQNLVSADHFTCDGTLIRSWASMKSLQRRDATGPQAPRDPDNSGVNFHGEKFSNATHVSRTDPEALLAKKGRGKEAHLCHSGHVLMENRHGLVLDVAVDAADGYAERRCALRMLTRVRKVHGLTPRTLGADAGYDDGPFLAELERRRRIVPHVPVKAGTLLATDAAGQARRKARGRMRQRGYAISQKVRKRVEEIIGWSKSIAALARTKLVGRWKIAQQAWNAGAAYNLLRLTRLLPAT
jgi:transposase